MEEEEWPGEEKSVIPHYLRDEAHHITNIDLGCALIPAPEKSPESYFAKHYAAGAFLCVLDLEKYAARASDAAVYVMPDIERSESLHEQPAL